MTVSLEKTTLTRTPVVITAGDVAAGDVIAFYGTEYLVAHVNKGTGWVELTLHDTNDGQPYLYSEQVEIDLVKRG